MDLYCDDAFFAVFAEVLCWSVERAFAFAVFGTMTSFLCRMACSAVPYAWASSGSKLGWIGEAFVAVSRI
jgi:hypothetical protein